jgi:hypothetical protein
LSERGDRFLGEAVNEVLTVRISGEVLEREHRDRDRRPRQRHYG